MEAERTHSPDKAVSVLPVRPPEIPAARFAAPSDYGHQLQQMVGNRTARRMIQTKLRMGNTGDTAVPRIQRMCSECAEKAAGRDEDEESEHVQRKAADAPQPEPSVPESAPRERSQAGLIVDDDGEAGPGQMKKSEFLTRLRASVCSEAEAAMAGSGQTTEGCPYIARWFDYYQDKDSRYIERALRKYAPEASGVSTASDYIPIVAARVRSSVETWSRTGEITGVPEDLAGQVMGAELLGAVGNVISGIGRGIAGIVSGIGGALSKIGSFLFKAKSGGARPGNLETGQLGLEGGHSLDIGVKQNMESAFGHDFSHVRVHTDGKAADASAQMNARAFTVGSRIAFASGEYQPGSLIGDALIAHELAHVVQQGGASGPVLSKSDGAKSEGPVDALEQDADSAAVRAIAGIWGLAGRGLAGAGQNAMPALKSGLGLQRCPKHKPPANVAAGTCVAPFAGVTFSLSNQAPKNSPNAATAAIVSTPLGPAGTLQGIPGTAHPQYNPSVTIHAPDDTTAATFEAGVIQNLLQSDRRFIYSGKGLIKGILPVPMKDGAPRRSGLNDDVFLENGQGNPGLLDPFTTRDSTVPLQLRDVPNDGAAVTLSSDPTCGSGTSPETLQRMILKDKFRTWVGVRHIPSKCVVTHHHIDWQTNWEATVSSPSGGTPTATLVQGTSDATVTNGDGSPTFIVGGDVPADVKKKKECKG